MAKSQKKAGTPFPLDRFDQVGQVGGITTAILDNGPGRGSRIAQVNTGAGLRYTIAIDRGADIVDASFNQHSLAYLTQNGIKPASPAYTREWEWLAGWPGGLMTTCGPTHIGHPRDESVASVGYPRTGLHGHHSNQFAEVEMLVNPDPHQGRYEMVLTAHLRDTRAYGPNVEVRRGIHSTLGKNHIRVFDEITNRDNMPVTFAMMYHCNLGWPLLDAGARLIMAGQCDPWPADEQVGMPSDPEDYKKITAPMKKHAGSASRGFVLTPKPDRNGRAHVGILNEQLSLALEIELPVEQLPRVMCWQHFAPGMYVTGIEPMVGSHLGNAAEPDHAVTLKPGETRRTELAFHVHTDPTAIKRFVKCDKRFK